MSRARLLAATRIWDVETVKALLESDPGLIMVRDGRGRTALHVCAEARTSRGDEDARRSVATARTLIAMGADVSAVYQKTLGEEMIEATPMLCAVVSGNRPLVEILLESGGAVDDCLWPAVRLGHVELALALVEKGARTDIRSQGETPLIYATRQGNEGMVWCGRSCAQVPTWP